MITGVADGTKALRHARAVARHHEMVHHERRRNDLAVQCVHTHTVVPVASEAALWLRPPGTTI